MDLFLDKKYSPDYEEYRGTAYYGRVDFTTLRTGLPPLDEFLTWLSVNVVEANVSAQKGRMLELKIWRSEGVVGIVPVYNWMVEFWFYFPASAQISTLAIPSIVWTILQLVLMAVIAVAIAASIWGAKEVIWGPPEAPPIIPYAILLGVFGFAFTPIIIEALRRL
ncbi:MAG: hypothetical protein ACTSSA_12645 [Candidatus Freyarchaeota archaeon]